MARQLSAGEKVLAIVFQATKNIAFENNILPGKKAGL
jgi:hypothetical protein